VSRGDWSFLERCTGPKFFVHSTHDEYGPQADLQAVFDRATAPKQLTWVDSADHFFSDALDQLEDAAYSVMTAPLA
jgi:alpha/beta superfamily hydrolase